MPKYPVELYIINNLRKMNRDDQYPLGSVQKSILTTNSQGAYPNPWWDNKIVDKKKDFVPCVQIQIDPCASSMRY
jgi:hypothetical protein